MSELRELYQTVILDHNRKPRNFRVPEAFDRKADGHNPLCGDKLTVYLQLDDEGLIEDIGFRGDGCAISKASASMMTEAVKGRPAAEANALFEAFHDVVTGDPVEEPDLDGIGKLAVFAGVREYPMRVKCATLAWHTLASALAGTGDVAKTE